MTQSKLAILCLACFLIVINGTTFYLATYVISIEQQLNYYDVKHQMIKNQGYPVHYCPVLLDV